LAQEAEMELKEEELSLEHIRRRLNTLDQRLDNIDTMVTALAERALKRPVSLTINCHNFGQTIDIAMVGSELLMI
jgi:tRNA(Ser,Leu) C12 N-acetylase TAN1